MKTLKTLKILLKDKDEKYQIILSRYNNYKRQSAI